MKILTFTGSTPSEALKKAKLEIGGRVITGIRETFGESQSGELIALFGTADPQPPPTAHRLYPHHVGQIDPRRRDQ